MKSKRGFLRFKLPKHIIRGFLYNIRAEISLRPSRQIPETILTILAAEYYEETWVGVNLLLKKAGSGIFVPLWATKINYERDSVRKRGKKDITFECVLPMEIGSNFSKRTALKLKGRSVFS
jgi:hypothetical protein